MAATKITDLAALPAASVDHVADLLAIVDVSDTSMAASGTDKKVTPMDIGWAFETITSDFPINAGAANALTDITGLSFAVVAGQTYLFEFVGLYTVGASTTGSRWTVNGPAMSQLSFWSNYQLTATTLTSNAILTAVQLPAASNATSNVSNGGGNLVQIEGMFIPSANGTFQIQGAREVTTDTVTLKAGSCLKWKRTA